MSTYRKDKDPGGTRAPALVHPVSVLARSDNTFALHEFLRGLPAEGIPVRVRDYRRIARALQGEGKWTRRRLRTTLALLLAKDQAQETILLRRFDRSFHFSPKTDDVETMKDRDRLSSALLKIQSWGEENDSGPSKQRLHRQTGFVHGDGVEQYEMETGF